MVIKHFLFLLIIVLSILLARLLLAEIDSTNNAREALEKGSEPHHVIEPTESTSNNEFDKQTVTEQIQSAGQALKSLLTK